VFFFLRFTTVKSRSRRRTNASSSTIALKTAPFFAPNPIIFGFILTSRIPSQLRRGKEDPEREREEYEREKKKEKSARCDFYYRVVDLVVVVVVSSSFVFFPLRFASSSS
jgi:hypothetical protein